MSRVGETLRAPGVAAVYLAHGTFAGTDASGLLVEIDRLLPGIGAAMRRTVKQVIDALAGDAGNYTAEYARAFEEGINDKGPGVTASSSGATADSSSSAGTGPTANGGSRSAARTIPVRLFHWSSENSHIGRADAAVRLIDELAALDLPPDSRVLLWGHSHAGNVFALLTNLLAGDRQKVERFFDAAEPFYRWPIFHKIDLPVWKRVRERLLDSAASTARPLPSSDIVTFGTPLRYGWDARGCGKLLHVVHHRRGANCPPYVAPFPPRVADVLAALDGDYIQHWGIAGTNIMPSILTWRACWADWRLCRLLQPGIRARDLLANLRHGCRVHDAGTTLLVDYGPLPGNVAQHLAGHAVYTRLDWLAWHAELTARWLYESEESE